MWILILFTCVCLHTHAIDTHTEPGCMPWIYIHIAGMLIQLHMLHINMGTDIHAEARIFTQAHTHILLGYF